MQRRTSTSRAIESNAAPGSITTVATTTTPGPTTTVTRTVWLAELGWNNYRAAGNSSQRSNAWAAHWYNGHVYASYDSPMYGLFTPEGSRGLELFDVTDSSVAGAFDLAHLNPQTQENLLSCTVTATGSLRVGRTTTVRVTVKVLGQGVLGASVRAVTLGVDSRKPTNASGKTSFTIRPKRATKLNITVATQPNMLGCKLTKAIAKKR